LPERPIFLERPHFEEQRLKNRSKGQDIAEFEYGYLTAIVHEGQKLLLYPDNSVRFYDLASDPAELVDVAADWPERVAGLRSRLEGWMRSHQVAQPGTVEISDERLEILRQLGYIGEDDLGPGR
jgi:arylsulfatase A-like enzyme